MVSTFYIVGIMLHIVSKLPKICSQDLKNSLFRWEHKAAWGGGGMRREKVYSEYDKSKKNQSSLLRERYRYAMLMDMNEFVFVWFSVLKVGQVLHEFQRGPQVIQLITVNRTCSHFYEST